MLIFKTKKLIEETIFNYANFNCSTCNTEINARMVDGRLWYMSSALKEFQKAITDVHYELDAEFAILFNSFQNQFKKYDHASVLYLNYEKWKKLDVPELKKLFNQYFNDLIFKQEFTI